MRGPNFLGPPIKWTADTGGSANGLRGSCLRSRPAQACPRPPPVSGGSALPGALPSIPVRSELTAHVLPQHAQATHLQPVLLISTTIVYRCGQSGFSRNPTTRLPPCLTVPSPALRSD